MKIKTVINPRIISRDGYEVNQIKILCFIVIASALLFGSVIFLLSKDYLAEEILISFKTYFADFSDKAYFEIFTGVLLSHIPYIVLMAVCGTCAYGKSLIIILTFLKITGLSITNAAIYSEFGLKGIEYALLVFFPGKFFLMLSLVFMMNFCIDNSQQIKNAVKGEGKTEGSNNFYVPKVATAVLLFTLASAIDCFFTVSFSSLFSF